MKEILTQALGGQSIPQFAVAIFFALVGIFLRLIYHASQRNQASPNTPVVFSWSFLFKNNAMRLFSSNALSLLLILITLRFSDDILHVPLSPFVALIIGFGSDTLAEKFKEASRQIMPYETTQVDAMLNTAPDVQNKPAQQILQTIDPEKPENEQVPPEPVMDIKSTEEQTNQPQQQ